jgi:hypothetical protein
MLWLDHHIFQCAPSTYTPAAPHESRITHMMQVVMGSKVVGTLTQSGTHSTHRMPTVMPWVPAL